MNYEKYLVKKGKTDLLSSLKALDKKVLNEKMKDLHVKDINELKDAIIKKFAFILNLAKDDVPTIMYFERLLEHENSTWMSAYDQDIKALWVFVYENGNYYSYYIASEVKKIIKKMLFDGDEK